MLKLLQKEEDVRRDNSNVRILPDNINAFWSNGDVTGRHYIQGSYHSLGISIARTEETKRAAITLLKNPRLNSNRSVSSVFLEDSTVPRANSPVKLSKSACQVVQWCVTGEKTAWMGQMR